MPIHASAASGSDALALAALSTVQVVLLAWIASRGSRRRREDNYTGSGGEPETED